MYSCRAATSTPYLASCNTRRSESWAPGTLRRRSDRSTIASVPPYHLLRYQDKSILQVLHGFPTGPTVYLEAWPSAGIHGWHHGEAQPRIGRKRVSQMELSVSLSASATGANDAEKAPSLPIYAYNALPSRHLPTPLSDPCTARCPVPTDAPWLRLNYLSSLSIIHDSFSSNIGRLHRTRLRLVSGEQAEACHYALASRTGPQLRCSEATYALEGIKSPRRHKAHSTHCWQALESAGGSRRSP